jgi:hypothetical protein
MPGARSSPTPASSPQEPPQRPWPWLEESGQSPRPGRGRSQIRTLDKPTAGVTRAERPIPVIVHLYWLDGWEADMPAAAEAWTRDAVLVRWLDVDSQRRDWVPAGTVRRKVER